MLSAVSLIAIAIIAVALGLAFARKFLATGALVMANLLVHVLSIFSGRVALTFNGETVGTRTVIQHELGLHGDWLAAGEPIAFLQLLTSMFVHADFWHLLGNLIILLAFALPFEERIGHRPFLALYLVAGFAGALTQLTTTWGLPILMIGASGAVFGIIGAFAGAYPRLVLPLPLPLGFFIIFVRMKVMTAALVFAGLQLLYLQFLSPFDNTAYLAHLGGLGAGLVLAATYVRTRRHGGAQPTKVTIDVDKLRPFARNLSAQNALARLAMCMDEPELARAWMDKFVEHASCPESGGPIRLDRGHIICPDGSKVDLRL